MYLFRVQKRHKRDLTAGLSALLDRMIVLPDKQAQANETPFQPRPGQRPRAKESANRRRAWKQTEHEDTPILNIAFYTMQTHTWLTPVSYRLAHWLGALGF